VHAPCVSLPAYVRLPLRRTLMQLVDVEDPSLQRLLKRAKRTRACDPKTGWLSSDTWQRVRECMETRLRQVCHGARVEGGEFGVSSLGFTV